LVKKKNGELRKACLDRQLIKGIRDKLAQGKAEEVE
jgi:hypothetical protein